MRILAIDLGKNKSVFVDYQAGGSEKEFGKIATCPKDLHDLLVARRPDRLVIECGPAAGWICDLAASLGIATQVANTNDERWQWKKTKNKSDRVDALKLAQLSEMQVLPTVHVPEASVRQWRALIEYRSVLVDRRTAMKNSIRAIFERQGLKLPSCQKAWTQAGVKEIESEARALAQCPDLEMWRGMLETELQCLRHVQEQIESVEKRLAQRAKADGRVALLQSAPCVGPRLSETVVAMLDQPQRFKKGKQVGAYAGLAPRQWQSGQSVREGHISRWGNPLLRKLLVEVAWIGVRCKSWMLQVYEQVRGGSDKRKKIAIVAVARRLLVRLWAMLRDNCQWKESPAVREASKAHEAFAEQLATALS